MDYAYMNDDGAQEDQTLPMIVVRDRKLKAYASTFVDRKGASDYVLSFMVGFVREQGHRHVVLKSDDEPAIKTLKEAMRAALVGIDVMLEESPAYDHMANGEAEAAVREIKR